MNRCWTCSPCEFENAAALCFTPDGRFNPARIARMNLKIGPAQAEAPEPKSHRDQARDCIEAMVSNAPDAAVVFVLAALDECRQGKQVAVLAAGPLENLLSGHGRAVIGAFEAAARQHAKVRYLLSGAWGQNRIDPAVWARLVAAVAPGPCMDAEPRTPAAGLRNRVLGRQQVEALLSRPMG
jgi:hypothetical protein